MDLGKLHENVYLSRMTTFSKTVPLTVNLQLFGEEKTEPATSKKRREAREKGQVVQSKELTGAIQLLAVLVGINILKEDLSDKVIKFCRNVFDIIAEPDRLSEIQFFTKLMNEIVFVFLKVVLPILGIAMVSALVMLYFQVGILFTVKPLMPQLSKINPISGFKKLFSLRSLVELAKSIVKASLLLIIAGSYLMGRKNDFLTLFDMNIGQIFITMWDVIFNLVIRVAAFLIVMGILDYAYKHWQNEKDLRMSKKEIKDEYKMTEGDPQLKGKIKQKQREISMGRMMQEVPKADVIITNPTHFAVAVLYEPDENDAPMVIAKGKDLVAQRIKDIAAEHDIPIVENKPMARALFAQVEWGNVIPESLYHGVAEILAYVYNLKKKDGVSTYED